MPVSRDIAQTWRRPGQVFTRLAHMGRREDRAVMWLMIGCLLFFVSQLPILQRRIVLGEPPLGVAEVDSFAQAAIYVFFGTMMVLPLLLYILAALMTLLVNLAGLRVSGFGGRMALFWAWLASAPGALFYGLLAGFNGPEEPGTKVIGALWLAAFFLFWGVGLRKAAQEGA